MPYKKGSYSKKGSYRRKPVSRRQAYGRVAKDALKLARWTAGMINAEHKRIDTTVSLTPSTTASQVNNMTSMAQGTTNSTRNGNSVKFTSIYFRGNITVNASATATRVRLVWVLDRDPGGAAASFTDLYVNSSVNSLISPDARPGRFKVLGDRVYLLNNVNRPEIQINWMVTKRPWHVKYNGNAGTIADITRGAVLLFAVSDEATNTPTVAGNIRAKYLDN